MEFNRLIIRLPLDYLSSIEAHLAIQQLQSMGITEAPKDAVYNTIAMVSEFFGRLLPTMASIESCFNHDNFWEWISDRYDDPYQLSLCRQPIIYETIQTNLFILMLGLLREWFGVLQLLPFEEGLYIDYAEFRSDFREVSLHFECPVITPSDS